MPEYIDMEMLLSFRVFTKSYEIRRDIINFVSQRNFKQTFVSEIFLRKSNVCFFVEIGIYTKTLPFNKGKIRTP